mmetsp:Transcript_24480/g.66820  ORF Transcript_24480/g.66820 Transcript_24480/m.66820 type:complete len:96 (-) Transcript_24480:609-896(-)|eukprot:1141884-Pelagomonas_calceolata.AAC.2
MLMPQLGGNPIQAPAAKRAQLQHGEACTPSRPASIALQLYRQHEEGRLVLWQSKPALCICAMSADQQGCLSGPGLLQGCVSGPGHPPVIGLAQKM